MEKVTKGLGITEERLRQMDTHKKELELTTLLGSKTRTKVMMMRANDLATELVEKAIGYTEAGFALNNLGKVEYHQRCFDEAHETWLRSLEYARILQDKFDDNSLFRTVSANLMLTFILRKDYSNMEVILEDVEKAFPDDIETLGMTYYTRMNMANDRGHLKLAKEYAYRSYEFFKQASNTRQITHALINIAHFEYLAGNFSTAAMFLANAVETAHGNDDIQVIAVKDYLKALIQLNDFGTATHMLEKYDSFTMDYPDYWGKLQIMKTIITNDPTFAELVSSDLKVSQNVRYFACHCLFEFYVSKGDSDKAISYYEKGHLISGKNSFLTKGDF